MIRSFLLFLSFSVSTCFFGCASYSLFPKSLKNQRKGFFDKKITVQKHTKENFENNKKQMHSHDGPVLEGASKLDVLSLGFKWPLDFVSITSPFGKRGSSKHEGIDLSAPVGTPVYASQDGVVIYAGSRLRGYGRLIVIKHKKQIATIYAHNFQLLVHHGQSVRRGQKIALSGATGRVTGPHVHFEIRRGMVALNPLAFLSKSSHRLAASQ